jgi:tricorn protease-like protein
VYSENTEQGAPVLQLRASEFRIFATRVHATLYRFSVYEHYYVTACSVCMLSFYVYAVTKVTPVECKRVI